MVVDVGCLKEIYFLWPVGCIWDEEEIGRKTPELPDTSANFLSGKSL